MCCLLYTQHDHIEVGFKIYYRNSNIHAQLLHENLEHLLSEAHGAAGEYNIG